MACIQPSPRPFLGKSGPQHDLAVESATPLDYFRLFIPLHLFAAIAEFTNKKARMSTESSESGRPWYPTSGAEIKAWFSSVMVWALLSFVQLLRFEIDKEVVIPVAEQKQLVPGHVVFSSCGDMCLTNWFDKTCVLTLSNSYGPGGDLFVEHWYPAKAGDQNVSAGGKVLKQVPIPEVVAKYRQNMGGVDTFDQYRSYI